MHSASIAIVITESFLTLKKPSLDIDVPKKNNIVYDKGPPQKKGTGRIAGNNFYQGAISFRKRTTVEILTDSNSSNPSQPQARLRGKKVNKALLRDNGD